MSRQARQGRESQVRRLAQKRRAELDARRRIAEILQPLSLRERAEVLRLFKKRLREEGLGG